MKRPYRTLCCYASEDERFLQDLKKHLMPLQREGLLMIQTDRDISPGKEREREIGHRLEGADIILLLISPDFIRSEYCFDAEMRQALIRDQRGTARVVPVIIRPTDWQGMPFGKLQPLPKGATPISTSRNRDTAYLSVIEGIRTVVQESTTRTALNGKPVNSLASSAQESSLLTSSQERNSMDTRDDSSQYIIKNNKDSVNHQVIGGRHGQVISGEIIYMDGKQKDEIQSLEKGSEALWHGDYRSAKKKLHVAVEEIDGQDHPGEASRACCFLALALLEGKLPRTQGGAVMQSIQELMNTAIRLHPCASYYRIFACIQRNFFEHNGFKHRLKEVDLLEHEATSLPPCTDDEENEKYFLHLQPLLQI